MPRFIVPLNCCSMLFPSAMPVTFHVGVRYPLQACCVTSLGDATVSFSHKYQLQSFINLVYGFTMATRGTGESWHGFICVSLCWRAYYRVYFPGRWHVGFYRVLAGLTVTYRPIKKREYVLKICSRARLWPGLQLIDQVWTLCILRMALTCSKSY